MFRGSSRLSLSAQTIFFFFMLIGRQIPFGTKLWNVPKLQWVYLNKKTPKLSEYVLKPRLLKDNKRKSSGVKPIQGLTTCFCTIKSMKMMSFIITVVSLQHGPSMLIQQHREPIRPFIHPSHTTEPSGVLRQGSVWVQLFTEAALDISTLTSLKLISYMLLLLMPLSGYTSPFMTNDAGGILDRGGHHVDE